MKLDAAQLKALGIDSMEGRGLTLEYIGQGGTVIKKEAMPWMFINALALENALTSGGLLDSVKGLTELIKQNQSGGMSADQSFLTAGITLVTESGISLPGISMTLAPTADPTTFRALMSIGLNNMEGDNVSGVEANGDRGYDLDATPGLEDIKDAYHKGGVGNYITSAADQIENASRILRNNRRQGSGTSKTGESLKKYALQGWFETEVSWNFEKQKWEFVILTGGFTAGGGMGYEWTWNMQVGPVPVFFQLEAGAAGASSQRRSLEKGNAGLTII